MVGLGKALLGTLLALLNSRARLSVENLALRRPPNDAGSRDPETAAPVFRERSRDLVREINLANRLWGAPRIHGELLKLGFEVAQSTVAKYMIKRRGPRSQSWTTFLRNHADGIAGRRRVIHYSVTAHPSAEWIARQIVEAFPGMKGRRMSCEMAMPAMAGS